jgi:hypothetical protein
MPTLEVGRHPKRQASLNLKLYKTLCRTGAKHGLRNLGDLVTRPDDGVPHFILDDVNLLVLLLRALPDLNLASATDDTHPHGGE